MDDVKVPRLNTNDEHYILTEWLAADGTTVTAGDSIAVIETSKATNELTCEQTGILRRLLPEMTVCRQGDVIARISTSSQDLLTGEPESRNIAGDALPDSEIAVTDAARDLMRKHGLSILEVAKPDSQLIRLADVETALQQKKPSRGQLGMNCHVSSRP